MYMTVVSRFRSFWQRWPWKWPIIVLLVIGIIGIAGLTLQRANQKPEVVENDSGPRVTVRPFARLLEGASVTKTALIEPAQSAPLVARQGGRVTDVNASLGDTVRAGTIIVEIDGDAVGNPTQAQIQGSAETLRIFDDIQKAAVTAADTAVQIAQLNLTSAKASRPLTNEQADLARRLADTAVENTRLALQDARDTGNDDIIRAADLASKAAQLSQDQATAGRELAQLQSNTAVQQALASLRNAELSRQRTAADLATQRVQIRTQLRVAQEQYALQQVTTPVNGEVTRLTARVGDFISPGQVIGEVNALQGAHISIDVSTAARNQLQVGQTIPITADGQEFSGEIAFLSSHAATATGLWQVDIFVTSTPRAINPNDTVTVILPSGGSTSGTTFIPLDALTVRQSGTVIFTVDGQNQAIEHPVDVIGFSGDFVEARLDLPPDARVVVSGNRTLRDGDVVTVGE